MSIIPEEFRYLRNTILRIQTKVNDFAYTLKIEPTEGTGDFLQGYMIIRRLSRYIQL